MKCTCPEIFMSVRIKLTMKFQVVKVLIFVFCVMAGSPGYAVQNQVSVTVNDANVTKKKSEILTVFFDLQLKNCDAETGALINAIIRKQLAGVQNLKLISQDEVSKVYDYKKDGSCFEKKCANKYSRKMNAQMAIIGSITKDIRAIKEQMGKEGELQYLYEMKKHEYYTVKVDLVDVLYDDQSARFVVGAKKNEVRKAIDDLITKINEKYKHLKAKGPPQLTPWISLSASCIVPHGKFSKIIKAAEGITVDVGLKNILIANTYCKLSGSYYFLSQPMPGVKKFSSAQVSFMGGYTFQLPNRFSITPSIGAGCHIHYLRDYELLNKILGRRNKTTYIDPLISVKCEGAYEFYKGLYLILTPGYTVFFEGNQAGNYVSIDLGMKYEIEIPDK